MKRPKAKSRARKKRATKRVSSPNPPVDLAQVRDQIRQAVGTRAVNMVNAAMDEVEDGRYLAMKYLFEIIGLYPAIAAAESPEEDSLGKILLRNLGIDPEIAEAQTKVLDSAPKGWASAAGDAVE